MTCFISKWYTLDARGSMLDPGYWILYQHRRSSIEDRASSIMC
ncbi:MAG: hypothetical protein AB1797_13595 [bacterium]